MGLSTLGTNGQIGNATERTEVREGREQTDEGDREESVESEQVLVLSASWVCVRREIIENDDWIFPDWTGARDDDPDGDDDDICPVSVVRDVCQCTECDPAPDQSASSITGYSI